MMIKTRAIVLNSIKFGESKVIIDLFTQQKGFLSFLVRVPKSSKSKIKIQFFQPLSILELEFDFRLNSKLQYISDVRLALPFTSIPFDSYKLSISLFLSEFLSYSLRNEQENSSLYSFLENSILWLDVVTGQFANFHLVFMFNLSRFLGFYPNVDNYSCGSFFDLQEGDFCEFAPLHRFFLKSSDSAFILSLVRLSYNTMHLCKMTRTDRNHCTEVILLYYRLHIPGFPELKSFSILKELFI